MSLETPEAHPYSLRAIGVTVWQAAEARIQANKRKIYELIVINRMNSRLLQDPKYAHMLEAERIATNAEAFQATPLPETDSGADAVKEDTKDANV